MAERRVCAGFRVSGYWKGWPCGAQATVSRYGAWWCRNHLPLDATAATEAITEREQAEEVYAHLDPKRGRWKAVPASRGADKRRLRPARRRGR